MLRPELVVVQSVLRMYGARVWGGSPESGRARAAESLPVAPCIAGRGS